MIWNWQQNNWPNFTYGADCIRDLEAQFLYQSGVLDGSYTHLQQNLQTKAIIDILCLEALKTSEIEGDYLDQESIKISLLKNFGLVATAKTPPGEQGIAELMTDVYQTFQEPLTQEMLFRWHLAVTKGRTDLEDLGRFRTHPEAMQVISGHVGKIKVHFEAPPSQSIPFEMERFIDWFQRTSPTGSHPLSPLLRAAIAHLYFVCIHPFEDGNGRIGRALCEKALSEALKKPTLIALSAQIQKNRKMYYDLLEASNKTTEITSWIRYFAQTILAAQEQSIKLVRFSIEKMKFYDRIQGLLNPRQQKAVDRLFEAGPEGFVGGLSTDKYIALTKASRATATRDLQDLVTKGILEVTGTLKSTRYHLKRITAF